MIAEGNHTRAATTDCILAQDIWEYVHILHISGIFEMSSAHGDSWSLGRPECRSRYAEHLLENRSLLRCKQ
jgi:hypothetical protein